VQLVIGRPDLQALLASRKLFPISKQLVVGADHELRGDRDPVGAGLAATVMASQVAGAIGGAALADAMFAVPTLAVSRTRRGGGPVLLGEVVATAGLLLLIVTLARTGRAGQAAWLVDAWIGAAYWFTSSTAFANPAVTIGRTPTSTYAGIAPASAPAFITAEILGGAIGTALAVIINPVQPHQITASHPAWLVG